MLTLCMRVRFLPPVQKQRTFVIQVWHLYHRHNPYVALRQIRTIGGCIVGRQDQIGPLSLTTALGVATVHVWKVTSQPPPVPTPTFVLQAVAEVRVGDKTPLLDAAGSVGFFLWRSTYYVKQARFRFQFIFFLFFLESFPSQKRETGRICASFYIFGSNRPPPNK